jgi:hypothetical protein
MDSTDTSSQTYGTIGMYQLIRRPHLGDSMQFRVTRPSALFIDITLSRPLNRFFPTILILPSFFLAAAVTCHRYVLRSCSLVNSAQHTRSSFAMLCHRRILLSSWAGRGRPSWRCNGRRAGAVGACQGLRPYTPHRFRFWRSPRQHPRETVRKN